MHISFNAIRKIISEFTDSPISDKAIFQLCSMLEDVIKIITQEAVRLHNNSNQKRIKQGIEPKKRLSEFEFKKAIEIYLPNYISRSHTKDGSIYTGKALPGGTSEVLVGVDRKKNGANNYENKKISKPANRTHQSSGGKAQ